LDTRVSRKGWFFAILATSFVIIYTVWYLYVEPQHIPLFLATAIVALSFVAVMFLLPKYGQRLVEKILAYHAKEKRLGGFYRYQKVAVALIIINSLIFSVVWRYRLIPSQYTSFYALTFLIITLASGIVLIAGLLKTAGKWGLLLIAILIIVGILRVWIWALSRA
jgi:hypothetical protein